MELMKRRKIVSREYKVMLQAATFAGSRKQLIATARRLWDDFSRAIGPVVVAAGGTLETIEKERLIVFLDSDAQHLRAGGYIFRVRRPLESKQPEVTLKFRHPDRYVAESRQMKSRRIQTETKFEEDIKAPFVSLYSFSSSGDIGKKPVPLDARRRLAPVSGCVEAARGGRRPPHAETGQRIHRARARRHWSNDDDRNEAKGRM